MKILDIELHSDTKARVRLSRGMHRKRWLSAEKNYLTKRWQLKSSNFDIHELFIEKLSKRT